jgi:phage tail sheath protein FI
MPAPYQTPGVYIEEISTLPPSVAQVATAIPAFIGYTANGIDKKVEVAQVTSLLEYELRFGKAKPTPFEADANGNVTIPADDARDFRGIMWYAIDLYFRNGGGRCYVISIGNESSARAADDFIKGGLAALEKEDEPTLIVMPEAVYLAHAQYISVTQAALAQCANLADRFAIIDIKDGDSAKFRNDIGVDNLDYGAAYHPYLDTALTHAYDEATVTVTIDDPDDDDPAETITHFLYEGDSPKDDTIKTKHTALYNAIKKNLAQQYVRLPPSAAIAGIYARVDRERGVWKAPANVGVLSVTGPSVRLTDAEQDLLNVDANSGKSINAIRSFFGKGTLVWGARTLAGNDNEWRYVSVRRLFIMIEESAKKASAFAVFEPNDATTWLKVKGMIENYLYGLWEQGALQGSKPEAAYYVHVGLGKTMSAQDILEGRMIVEIGIAAVRPAEFIILRFSHKLASA